MLISNDLHLTALRVTGAVTVRHPSGEFKAHFRKEYYEAAFSGGPAVESAQPALTRVRTIDVQSLIKDTPLQIDGETDTYFVKRHQPDGTGMSIVLLKR
jgi:hypothetical protein